MNWIWVSYITSSKLFLFFLNCYFHIMLYKGIQQQLRSLNIKEKNVKKKINQAIRQQDRAVSRIVHSAMSLGYDKTFLWFSAMNTELPQVWKWDISHVKVQSKRRGSGEKTAGWLTVKSQSFSRSRKRGTIVIELVSVKEGEEEEKKGADGGEEGSPGTVTATAGGRSQETHNHWRHAWALDSSRGGWGHYTEKVEPSSAMLT